MSTDTDSTQSQYHDSSESEYRQPTGTAGSAGSAGRPPLRRAYRGRMVAGVCAGIADYIDVDVTIVRVAFAVFALMGGAGIPAYLACLLLIPEEGTDESIASSFLDSMQHGTR